MTLDSYKSASLIQPEYFFDNAARVRPGVECDSH